MHAVRRSVLEAQADAAGLPLYAVDLPWPCPNAAYEALMGKAVATLEADGFTHIAFGDLFLEDIRRYREERLAGTSLAPLFPLWKTKPTRQLAGEMIAGGLRALLTCVDPRVLPGEFAGRAFDRALLADLPPNVDPCGENGEFHTLAWAGPMFARPLQVHVGERVERDGFVFADVIPGVAAAVSAPRSASPLS
jgi:diphthamide synthase (EF-2-diphthine--ammonia ligase)